MWQGIHLMAATLCEPLSRFQVGGGRASVEEQADIRKQDLEPFLNAVCRLSPFLWIGNSSLLNAKEILGQQSSHTNVWVGERGLFTPLACRVVGQNITLQRKISLKETNKNMPYLVGSETSVQQQWLPSCRFCFGF